MKGYIKPSWLVEKWIKLEMSGDPFWSRHCLHLQDYLQAPCLKRFHFYGCKSINEGPRVPNDDHNVILNLNFRNVAAECCHAPPHNGARHL